jgi:hypothetical protein
MTAASILLEIPRVIAAVVVCGLVPLSLRASACPRLARVALVAGALAAISLWLAEGVLAVVALARTRPSPGSCRKTVP